MILKMQKDIQNVRNLTTIHAGAAERTKVIGHLEMTESGSIRWPAML